MRLKNSSTDNVGQVSLIPFIIFRLLKVNLSPIVQKIADDLFCAICGFCENPPNKSPAFQRDPAINGLGLVDGGHGSETKAISNEFLIAIAQGTTKN